MGNLHYLFQQLLYPAILIHISILSLTSNCHLTFIINFFDQERSKKGEEIFKERAEEIAHAGQFPTTTLRTLV